MVTNSQAASEFEILAAVIAPGEADLPPEVARVLLQWRFSDHAVDRMNALADRNNKGTITEAEKEEIERYLRVGGLLNLVRTKARLSLNSEGISDS
jgi:uncharacterized protein YnzC (UPF0291/DUF896 family)